ncbi:sulfatase family protein [Neorhizobium sp. DT-125]|uniref:sulfatase family protein n=1 Tax=Neorhizobium sp. DT-125 TaxID=3396163 RepID=UPI003F1DD2BC
MRRPNFILFVTDQQRADYLGCYGHPIVQTPHIDKIARDGICFDRFYVASPVCMPNRASLMTARMPSIHGVRMNGIPLSLDAVTFVELMREGGYETALIGKSHLQNFTGLPPVHPEVFAGTNPAKKRMRNIDGDLYRQEEPEFWCRSDAALQLPFYGFDHVDLVTGHGDKPGGAYVRWFNERCRQEASSPEDYSKELPHAYSCPQAYRTAVPEHLYSTEFIKDRASAYLADLGSSDQPFFLMISFPDPHHPFNPPGKYWDMYRPEDFPVPEAFTRNDWTPPPHVAAAMAERDRGAARLNGMNTIAVTVREAQEAMALTCGMITCIDDAIGSIVSVLKNTGLMEDTVLAFTTDHGDHLGDHRLLLKGAEQYQSILRVPFIWADPKAEAPKGMRTEAIGSTIDIGTTILERAGLARDRGMQGHSLLPCILNGAGGRDAALIQYEHQRATPGLNNLPRVHSIVDDGWRLSIYAGVPWGELYDLANDPGEFSNLWDDVNYAKQQSSLIEKLLRLEIDHIDQQILPTGLA